MSESVGEGRPRPVRSVLSVEDLAIEFDGAEGVVRAVDHVSFDVRAGETVAIVGESGCGKTMTALAVLGLVPQPAGRIVSGAVHFGGRDLLQLSNRELRKIRGQEISMIFQEPASSLNPVFTIGQQIEGVLRSHGDTSRRAARARAVELLSVVGVPDAGARVGDYPHQWSGGMCQRAMIAMAMANRPQVLIADEPTTALDVTIQAQVLDALRMAQRETGAAVVLITHDLGVVAEMADRVLVMYAGRVVEAATVQATFHSPRHPYTVGLMRSLPRLEGNMGTLEPIPGQPPHLHSVPTGCSFNPRCYLCQGRTLCQEVVPALSGITDDHWSACHFSTEVSYEPPSVDEELDNEPFAPATRR